MRAASVIAVFWLMMVALMNNPRLWGRERERERESERERERERYRQSYDSQVFQHLGLQEPRELIIHSQKYVSPNFMCVTVSLMASQSSSSHTSLLAHVCIMQRRVSHTHERGRG